MTSGKKGAESREAESKVISCDDWGICVSWFLQHQTYCVCVVFFHVVFFLACLSSVTESIDT